MIALDVADNGDGTGGTAALAGTGGAAAAVYARRFDAPPSDGWQAPGGRTGDGVVPLPLAPGFWWVYAASGTAVTPPAALRVTSGLPSLPTRCRQAAAARIALLNLPGIRGIFQQFAPDVTGVKYPCVHLTDEDVATASQPDTNLTDLLGVPVRVTVADTDLGSPPDHRRLPQFDAWRYGIHRAFDGQRLPGVPESVRCDVEPFPDVRVLAPGYQNAVAGLLVRCWCRAPRGLGV